jgi:hypothetical protein
MGGKGKAAPAQRKHPQPPLKTNIRKITGTITGTITAMGFDIWVSFSKHSKSRYLEVHTRPKIYVIRISDHPLFKGHFDYDVYTDRRRYGASNYVEFLNLFREQIKADRKLKNGKMPEVR